MYLLTDMPLVN